MNLHRNFQERIAQRRIGPAEVVAPRDGGLPLDERTHGEVGQRHGVALLRASRYESHQHFAGHRHHQRDEVAGQGKNESETEGLEKGGSSKGH